MQDPIESKIDDAIDSLFTELAHTKKTDPEYGTIIDHMTKLNKLRPEPQPEPEKEPTWVQGIKPPSLDQLLVVGANLFGIIWLTRFEKEHVIPSQSALKFVMKPR